MALTPQPSKPKWTEPNAVWKEDDAPPLMDMMRSEADVDRFHNHEDQSPEAMAQAITDLKATVDTLGGRLAAVEEGTSGVVHAAKDLGTNMVKMGDALTKRVKDLEGDAERATAEATAAKAEAASARAALAGERKAREKTVRMAMIGGAVVVAALVALTLFGPKLGAGPASSPAPVLYSPNAPAN
ncbi:MAG TPA: hypothetical protein VGF42_00795 [Caulobacteraceae bacterium]|jgi:hypothetical protein